MSASERTSPTSFDALLGYRPAHADAPESRGVWLSHPAGPHPRGSFEVLFTREVFPEYDGDVVRHAGQAHAARGTTGLGETSLSDADDVVAGMSTTPAW